jgi:hypothetical protein
MDIKKGDNGKHAAVVVVVGDDDSRAARSDSGHGENIPQHDRRNQAKPAG